MRRFFMKCGTRRVTCKASIAACTPVPGSALPNSSEDNSTAATHELIFASSRSAPEMLLIASGLNSKVRNPAVNGQDQREERVHPQLGDQENNQRDGNDKHDKRPPVGRESGSGE